MKKKDLEELKNKSIENLKKVIAEKEKESTTTRIELNMSKIKNVHKSNQLKKEIARIKTILQIKQFTQNV